MAFYDIDTAGDHAQQAQQQAGAKAAQNDPDIQHALRGIYTGKYADLARSLPAAWPAPIRNAQVAQAIAYDKGIDTSGLDTTNNFSPTNTGTPFAVQIAPYVFGGITGAGAAGAFGSGAGVVPGGSAASAVGPYTGGYAGLGGASSTAVPASLAATGGGGMSVAQILAGMGGTGPYSWIPQLTGLGLNYLGQQQQLGANQDALSQQLASTKYATDASSLASTNQLAFLRQQAAYDAASAEANRSGNYDQWAAKQRQLGTVGQALGLPARDIPAYVPLPVYGGGAPAGAPAGPATAPPAASSAGYVNAQGQPINLDPAEMTTQAQASFQRQFGRPATEAELSQVLHYASKPDLYSDQQWRIGVNDYLVQRVGSQSASADPRLAGTAGIIAGPAGAPSAAPPAGRYQPMTAPLATVADYFADPSAGIGRLTIPQPALTLPQPRPPYGGAVGSYLA